MSARGPHNPSRSQYDDDDMLVTKPAANDVLISVADPDEEPISNEVESINSLAGLNTRAQVLVKFDHGNKIVISSDEWHELVVQRLEQSAHASKYRDFHSVRLDFSKAVVKEVVLNYVLEDASAASALRNFLLSIETADHVYLTHGCGCFCVSDKCQREFRSSQAFPIMNGIQNTDCVIFKNNERTTEHNKQIADANLNFLTEYNRDTKKGYVYTWSMPGDEDRAVIPRQSEQTLELIMNALAENSPFDFGEIQKSEFRDWLNNPNFDGDNMTKWLPRKLMDQIRKLYYQMQCKYVYTHNMSAVSIKLDPIDKHCTNKDTVGIVSLCFDFFVPTMQDI
ncbi:hypothetical protein CYMTET_44682 [Cymbomonas tetramitiformis]|uniref:Uncharacterized protein n=1 Tax=Cymbomonas tetramitiformis TaxID=36881 RepID=A0AAE0BZY2_9CHLO|nr:hypothetical protein CYMTET_44682 [Cymbomonas tetramitiformis]